MPPKKNDLDAGKVAKIPRYKMDDFRFLYENKAKYIKTRIANVAE